MAGERYQHIKLPNSPDTIGYTRVSKPVPERNIPPRPRGSHSRFLRRKLDEAWGEAEDEQAVAHATRDGVYLEFKSDPGAELVTKSLEDMRSKKVRLLNVRMETEVKVNEDTGEEEKIKTTYATVYVANEKKNYFLEKVQQYADAEKDTASGRPRNADLIDSIAHILKARPITSFWTDSIELIPGDNPEWCEVWLRTSDDEVTVRFEALLTNLEIEAKQGVITFPERSVKVILVNKAQLEELSKLSDDIAEYRRAKETAAFWMDMENKEQAEWVEDLLERLKINPKTNVSVCILDTGVNNGHPLLNPVLSDNDCESVDSDWGTFDHKGHGTLMAGLAAYGDLRKRLSSTGRVTLNHKLESVKILPIPPDENEPDIWGDITAQGVSIAEMTAPDRQRIICLAVTATDTRDRGRPSSWSGALDNLTSGAEEEDKPKRLVIVAAGNVGELILPYHAAQQTDSVHDPAQAWNALTVGAFTKLDEITDATLIGYSPIAPKNGLSPFSTTSRLWDEKWPIKPDIVMEGGNAAYDGKLVLDCDDLSLLSTNWKPAEKHFSPFNMTSAATAEASRLAAQIQVQYPEFWPETIKALIVHSAEWTDTMKSQFLPKPPKKPKKSDYLDLLRCCGYGVPNLERALYSASNSLTLISEAELQPYKKDGSYKTKDMHLYELPWPVQALEELQDTEVTMRITLSYFVEPGPSDIGWDYRYRYPSYGLRFDLKSPTESKDNFEKRINAASREEKEKPEKQSTSSYWKIGSTGRDKGSIHSDIWEGSAVELASSNIIAVYPIIGWWRERSYLGKVESKARYSLIVSIHTPEVKPDIYIPVATQVGITVPISISIE